MSSFGDPRDFTSGSDTESTGPDSPSEDDEDTQTHHGPPHEQAKDKRTEATFAFVEVPKPTSRLLDERVKWVRRGSKPGKYVCPECGKGLSRHDSLERHRRTRHHIGKQYYCHNQECEAQNLRFGRFDNFKRHMEVAHGVVVNNWETRKTQRAASSNTPGTAAATDTAPAVKLEDASRPGEDMDSLQAMPATHSRPPLILSRPASPPDPRDMRSQLTLPPILTLSEPRQAPQDDFGSLSRDDLTRLLKAKIRECDLLQEQNRMLTLERDEYLEALRISEELRGVSR